MESVQVSPEIAWSWTGRPVVNIWIHKKKYSKHALEMLQKEHDVTVESEVQALLMASYQIIHDNQNLDGLIFAATTNPADNTIQYMMYTVLDAYESICLLSNRTIKYGNFMGLP
jgi:hypothetical protein